MAAEQEFQEETRLWIGHLDYRITEFQLLKILQQFGEIDKFDMLFHKSGPSQGQPRGYAFVTYKKAVDAVKALTKLDGQKIGIKHCSIRFAKNVNYDDMGDRPKPRIEIPALGGAKDGAGGGGGSSSTTTNTKGTSSRSTTTTTGDRKKDSAIQAIEAKLRHLERGSAGDEFRVNRTSSALSQEAPISKYQYNLHNEGNGYTGKYTNHKRGSHRGSRPYGRGGGRGGGPSRR